MGKRSKKPIKPNTSAAAKAKKTKSSSSGGSGTAPKYTVEDLLVKIDGLMETFEFEAAQQFCERALQINPNHPQLLDTTAAILLELGNPDQAYEVLCRAVEISPDVGHVKYMYLGQMCAGMEGAQHYIKGLSIMESLLASQSAAASSQAVAAEEVCAGYCSLAELYLTDLCFEEDAAVRCGEFIAKALHLCPDSPEALQMMASFRMSEGNSDEAKQLIVKSVDSWLPSPSEQEASAYAAAKADEDEERCVPPYPARVAAAKILIEVGEHQRAFSVLDGLIDDDDEVISVWYLFGWAHYHCDEKSDSRTYLQKAKELTAKHECDDEAMLTHIDELLAELGPESDNEDGGQDEEVMET
ncbi:uncharacterized protein LOC135818229 [Sycon ciliatum]|uniref:uncharacterized protein LOC135818229 n=1 Tax=Sycon ciliatum TaxID=27933 RepID=UPI0031F708B8